MNTLARAVTAQILTDSTTYAALRKRWSDLMNSERRHELSVVHHLLYLALLGKDWRKGFTPPTNRRKLENGAFLGWALFRALNALHWKYHEQWLLAPFEGVVTPEMLARIRAWLPVQNPYAYRPEQFADGAFPFEAYTMPEALMVEDTDRRNVHA